MDHWCHVIGHRPLCSYLLSCMHSLHTCILWQNMKPQLLASMWVHLVCASYLLLQHSLMQLLSKFLVSSKNLQPISKSHCPGHHHCFRREYVTLISQGIFQMQILRQGPPVLNKPLSCDHLRGDTLEGVNENGKHYKAWQMGYF